MLYCSWGTWSRMEGEVTQAGAFGWMTFCSFLGSGEHTAYAWLRYVGACCQDSCCWRTGRSTFRECSAVQCRVFSRHSAWRAGAANCSREGGKGVYGYSAALETIYLPENRQAGVGVLVKPADSIGSCAKGGKVVENRAHVPTSKLSGCPPKSTL